MMNDTQNIMEQYGLMSQLLTHMPAMVFSKDAATGVYLACNQSFAEYAHKASPEDVGTRPTSSSRMCPTRWARPATSRPRR